MAKPTNTLEWTASGGAVVQPTSGKQAAGYEGGERLPAQHQNWALVTETDWQEYVKAGFWEGAFGLASAISPTAIVGTVDDYAPTGLSGAQVIRQDLNAGHATLNGLTGGADGRLVVLVLIDDTWTLTLAHDAGASTAANRFFLPGGIARDLEGEGSCAILRYDGTSSRWRVLSVHSVGSHKLAAGSDFQVQGAGRYRHDDISHNISVFDGVPDEATPGSFKCIATSGYVLHDVASAVDNWMIPVSLRMGLTVSQVRVRVRDHASKTITAELRNSVDGTAANLGSDTSDAGGGWQWLTISGLSETPGAGDHLYIRLSMANNSNDVFISHAEVTYAQN